MKRKKRCALSLLLVLVFFVTNISSSGFAMPSEETTKVLQEAQLRTNITEIEDILASQGTSVEKALDDAVSRMERDISSTDDAISRMQYEDLIETTRELEDAYIAYKNDPYGIKPNSSHPVIVVAVATVASYFSKNGYLLAFELLIHARDNKKLNSNYTPNYGWRIQASPVYQRLRSGKDSSGSAAFEKSKTPILQDLYYAIHNFDYTVSRHKLYLTDRYDYGLGDYPSVAGVAIRMMRLAQDMKYLTPYYVKIAK